MFAAKPILLTTSLSQDESSEMTPFRYTNCSYCTSSTALLYACPPPNGRRSRFVIPFQWRPIMRFGQLPSCSSSATHNHRRTSQGAEGLQPPDSGKVIIFGQKLNFRADASSQKWKIVFIKRNTRSSATAERQRVSYTRLSRLTHWSCTSLSTASVLQLYTVSQKNCANLFFDPPLSNMNRFQ